MVLDVVVVSAVAVAFWMLSQWLLSIFIRNVSIVDIGWGLGFVIIAWISFATTGHALESNNPAIWLAMMVSVWGLRLSSHLAFRNHGRPEDFRYAAMRTARGPAFVWSSLWIVFGLQGAVMWLVALPIQLAAARPAIQIHSTLAAIAGCVWFTGLLFESLGDWQLARFKADPSNHGRVMDRGLWRWTRHPNYFGDCMVWWGHWLMSLALGDMSATALTVVSPLLMTFLLIRVSGVALLEKTLKQRSPEYLNYIKRTSAFIPLPPRKRC